MVVMILPQVCRAGALKRLRLVSQAYTARRETATGKIEMGQGPRRAEVEDREEPVAEAHSPLAQFTIERFIPLHVRQRRRALVHQPLRGW